MCGACVGLGLALYVLVQKVSEKAVARTTEMQPAAYVLLAAMLGILVIGLAWCFYHAIKAAAKTADKEEQISEI